MNPFFEEALFNLASVYYNTGEFSKSAKYFEKGLELFPDNFDFNYLSKCAFYKSGKNRKEEKELIERCPEYIELKITIPLNIEYKYQFKNDRGFILQNINSLALSYIKEGRLRKAIEKFQNGLKVWDECPEINYNLGSLYSTLNNLNEAEKYALRATKSSQFFKLTKRQKEKRDITVDSLPIGKWTFDLALEEGNNFLEAYDLLGNIYFKKREFEKSALAFKKVLEIDPSDALGHYNLGCAYFALKEYEKAEESWKKAIKNDRRKKERAEEAVEESGQMPRVSVTVLKRTVSFHSYKSLGSLYQEKGELKKAIESYQKAIEIFPTDADCYYELGKLYIQTGEKENAVKNLKKYLEYGTEKEKEVRELLQKLKEK